jgi:hypothetical protein
MGVLFVAAWRRRPSSTRALRIAASLALCAGFALSPKLGEAQQSPDRSAEARALFERGVQLIDEGRFGEAITTLEASERLRPSPAVSYNLGLALRGVGRPQAAIAAFERYLAQPSRSATPTELTQVRAIVAELRASLAQLALRIEPATAVARIDGAPPQTVTGLLTLDPGAHTIELSAPGFVPTTRTIELAAGARETLSVSLEALPSIATLVIEPTVATATVWIDGHVVGRGTITQTVSVGAHTVRVDCPQCESAQRTVRFERGQHLRVGVDVIRRSAGVPGWAIGVAVGASVAAVATGVAVGVFAATNGPTVGEYTGQHATTWGMSHMLPKRTR